MSTVTGYILSHPQWGWLVIAPYPSLWLNDRTKAHRFATLAAALHTRKRWDKSIEITVMPADCGALAYLIEVAKCSS